MNIKIAVRTVLLLIILFTIGIFLLQSNSITAQSPDPFPYLEINIGSLGGDKSSAYGINNNNWIVGQSNINQNDHHAFLWIDGHMQDLGTLGGTNSIAYGINNNGQIVGESQIANNSAIHAFVWQNGQMSDLGVLQELVDEVSQIPADIRPSINSSARSINDNGEIVGESRINFETFRKHAALWKNGQSFDLHLDMKNMQTLLFTEDPIESYANGINNSGQIVGTMTFGVRPSGDSLYINSEPQEAFLWNNGLVSLITNRPTARIEASDINNAGQITVINATNSVHPGGGFISAYIWPTNTVVSACDPEIYGGAALEFLSINNSGGFFGARGDTGGPKNGQGYFICHNGQGKDFGVYPNFGGALFVHSIIKGSINDNGNAVVEDKFFKSLQALPSSSPTPSPTPLDPNWHIQKVTVCHITPFSENPYEQFILLGHHSSENYYNLIQGANSYSPKDIIPPNHYSHPSSNQNYWANNIAWSRGAQNWTPQNEAYWNNACKIPPIKAEYYDNRFLQGAPKLTREDQDINFDWSNGSPDPSIPNDDFSVRWTKVIFSEDSDYKFTLQADDGVRLFVDGVLILDKWKDQPPTTYEKQTHLTEGIHEIVLEFYERGGGAVAKFNYEKIEQSIPSTTNYNAEYFDNITLSGSPKLTRNENLIDNEWGGASPDVLIPVDNFSARWTKTETFVEGIYSFKTTADDGVRVFVDGTKIIDKWQDQAPSTYTSEIYLSEGEHIIKMEYFEHGGGATAKLQYDKEVGYLAKHWNLSPFNPPPNIPNGTPVLTRIEEKIQNDWTDGGPSFEGPGDHFVAQWTRKWQLEGGTYIFNLTSDDGVRFYIDNNLVLDQWNDHARTDFSIVKSLTEGPHDFRVEYYEHGGNALVYFDFEKTNTTASAFTGQYFDNMTLTGTPKLTRDDSAINFFWGAGSPAPELPSDQFSARWTKQETFTTPGNYTFNLSSDDGIRFWIDDVLIVDDWTNHPTKTYTPSHFMSAGTHTFKIEYFENGGNATVSFK